MRDIDLTEKDSTELRLEFALHHLGLLISFCIINNYGEKSPTFNEAWAYYKSQVAVQNKVRKLKGVVK